MAKGKGLSVTTERDDFIVDATGIHKTYSTGKVTVAALRGIDLRVRRGEMVAIMGPSGCGKTTTLNCLSGLTEIDAGSVMVEGQPIHDLPDDERSDYRARRMGFVFQLYNLLPVLSAVENVEMPLLVSGESAGESRRRSMDLLDQVGLADWADHLPSELSGGQRQRVTIARALVNQPAIVWADEPTGDLDSETAQEVMALMTRLNEDSGETFIIVTHSREVGEIANRIVRMRDGLVIDDGLGGTKGSVQAAALR